MQGKRTFSQSWQFTKKLLKDAYTGGGSCREEFKKLQKNLYFRAWIIHSILTVARVIELVFGNASW